MNNFQLNVLLKKEALKIVPGCIINNELNDLVIDKRIGTPSVDGEAYSACYPKTCKMKLAIKKIPIRDSELKLIKKSEEPDILNKSYIFTELLFMKLTNFLVSQGITINLPIIYSKYLCEDQCKFENKQISSNVKNCIVMVSELADGDLKKMLTELKLSQDEMKIVYFQIYASLYCFHKYFKAVHNDLHWGNVLFHRIPAGGYFEYIIEGKHVIIPNIGYIMVLWDFGRSFIPGKLTVNDRKNSDATIDEDYRRVTDMLYGNKTPGSEIINTANNNLAKALHLLIDKSKNYRELTASFGVYISQKNVKKSEILATFNMDKKVTTLDKTIKKYLNKAVFKPDSKKVTKVTKVPKSTHQIKTSS